MVWFEKVHLFVENVSYETTVFLEEKSEGRAAILSRGPSNEDKTALWIFKTCFQTLDETLDVVVGCSPVAIVIRTQYFKENPTVCPL